LIEEKRKSKKENQKKKIKKRKKKRTLISLHCTVSSQLGGAWLKP